MAGRKKIGPISEPDFDSLLQALSSTTKGRAFLDEYHRRSQPTEMLGLLDSLKRIERTLGLVRDRLRPERLAAELRHISMTLDVVLDGAPVDPGGDETARRFSLADRARRELRTLAEGLAGEVAPAPDESDQAVAASPDDAEPR